MAKDARIAELVAQLAAKDARIEQLEALVAKLTEQVAVLSEKLGRNSKNSQLPPSSDPPARPGSSTKSQKSKKQKSRRKRGGQRGHRGAHRALLPKAQVSEFIDLFPQTCENCWRPLPEVADPRPKRHQIIEAPPMQPEVKEFRRHAVQCAHCGHKTRAPYDETLIPSSPFGPRLMSMVGLLTGVYHVSRRKTVTLLSDMLGVKMALGTVSAVEARVSEAVKPAVDEVCDHVEHAEVKHTDGTGWLKAGATMSLWTIATTAVTLYKIVADSSRATLKPLFGALRGILVSDRAKALAFWVMKRRQICWAHLLRKFVSFSERDGRAGQFGCDLLSYTGLLFEYWQDYKAGNLDRRTFRAWMLPVREQIEAVLANAVDADIERLSGSCADILAHKDALWTFLERDDVEPTNNHAERELRAFVLWRKRSFGTQSERGNLYAERIMTVAHTARKQGKDVLEFLTKCCTAQQTNTEPPSLLGNDSTRAA
ncbi:MAG: IS66 family transposase [Exiguobacterium marinum]|uniref:IS66 family transposase n=1 Tax=Exiguobacterium marinum TaxID=273528 RepID=UPI003C35B6FF